MKTLLGVLVLAVIIIGGYFYLHGTNPTAETDTSMATSTNQTSEPEVVPIMHATAYIRWGGSNILTDPTDAKLLTGRPSPDIVLVTDIHPDHFSTSTLATMVGANTSLIVPQAVADLLPADLKAKAKILKNGETISEKGFSITGVAMYNLPGKDNSSFHTKGRGNGYIVEKDGKRVYIAGDTAGTPEMRGLTGIDIALVPMNLPYTMGVDEAADAVLAFKPKTVYPYHYRGQDGLSDVNKFKTLVKAGDSSIEVVLANWYPTNN